MQFTPGALNSNLLLELEKEYQFGREVGQAFLRVHELLGKLLVKMNGGLGTLNLEGVPTMIDSLEDHYPGMKNDEYSFMASSIFHHRYCDFVFGENEGEDVDELPLVEVIDQVLSHEMDKLESGAVILAVPDASKG